MPLNKLEEVNKVKIAQRGKGKKYAILMAALKLFGDYGLKATSVRMIAKEANANIASVPYYFTSKENLYKEIVLYIGQQIHEHMQEVAQSAQIIADEKTINKKQALAAIQMMMRHMATMLIESDEPKAWAQIIMREQANPTDAFDIIYERFMHPMQIMGGQLVGACLDIDPDCPEVKIRLHALKGQVLGFLVSRESLVRSLGVKKLDQNHYKLIYRTIDTHIHGSLNRPLST